MRKILSFIVPVAICFMVGFGGAFFQQESLSAWYPGLIKPMLTPPNGVFPVAWSILYVCMGISVGFVLVSRSPRKRELLGLFIAQLALNFLWSILFFALRSPALGLACILSLDVLVVLYAIRSWPSVKWASALFWPYAAWLLFATYLNLFILWHN